MIDEVLIDDPIIDLRNGPRSSRMSFLRDTNCSQWRRCVLVRTCDALLKISKQLGRMGGIYEVLEVTNDEVGAPILFDSAPGDSEFLAEVHRRERGYTRRSAGVYAVAGQPLWSRRPVSCWPAIASRLRSLEWRVLRSCTDAHPPTRVEACGWIQCVALG
jgi:hypothetical protein